MGTTHFTMPIIPLCIFIWNFVQACQSPYGDYPGWMQGIGWFLMAVCILLIPIGALFGCGKGGGKLDMMPGFEIAQAGKKKPEPDDSPKADILGAIEQTPEPAA